MSPFEYYLRTGRILLEPEPIEHKFNPWHDADDGRFTFAGQGNYFRAGAPAAPRSPRASPSVPGIFGGGSFSGGGAGGSWDAPRSGPTNSSPSSRPSKSPRAATVRVVPISQTAAIIKNGYSFEIDGTKRSTRILGWLHLKAHPRSRREQANAGKPDRRSSDDGGHFIAARFNGPREWFNHFAQDAKFNRGAYRVLEDGWARDVRAGKRVFVEIAPFYRGTSRRPYRLNIKWYVDGKPFQKKLANEGRGK